MESRTWFLTALIASCFASAACVAAGPPSSDAEITARARAIDAHILKIDAHTDVLLPGAPELNYAPGHTSRTDLENLTRGGIGAVAFAIAVGPGPRTPDGVKAARAEADAKLAWIRGFVKGNPDRVALASPIATITSKQMRNPPGSDKPISNTCS